jgi:uncharacterized protein YprB with RNaseH-like and TPR domain
MPSPLAERLRDILGARNAVPMVSPEGRKVSDLTPHVDAGGPGFDQKGPNLAQAGRAAARQLGAEWCDAAEGSFILADRFYPGSARHGRTPVASIVERLASGRDALGVIGRAWPSPRGFGPSAADRDRQGSLDAVRDEPDPPADPASAPALVFLDLETTGLAGGAGTQAFLVGCAVVEDEGLRVRQWLLPGFEHERALLAEVAAWRDRCGTLVTFNGRSFDVPLIETRFLYHRLPFPLTDLPHLDMLHPARRLWKARPSVLGPPPDEDSCRLNVLERHLAGVHRVGDVPGFEIPSRYFHFVRNGDARPLQAVLEHNRQDLLSLALVTAHALSLIERGPSAAAHSSECLGLGRLFERAGRSEEAEACYAQAAHRSARVGHEPFVRAEALKRLASCRRRAGRVHEAALAWRELMTLAGCPASIRQEAREALAVHHEHRTKDLQTARALVLDVLSEDGGWRRRAEAEHRLRRIDRKLQRPRGGLMAALDAL